MVLPCRPGKPEAGLKPSSHQQSPLLALARWARKGPAGPALPSLGAPAMEVQPRSPTEGALSQLAPQVPDHLPSALGPGGPGGQHSWSMVYGWSVPLVQGIRMVSALSPGYLDGQSPLSRVSKWSALSVQGI